MRPLLAGARRALLWNVAAGVVIGLATAAAIVILVVLTEGFRDVDVAPYHAFFGGGYGLTLGTAAGGVHAGA
jgi:MFS-type transporter involved in bile tolerance (Atg22 family)